MSDNKNKFEIDKNTIFAIYHYDETISYIFFDDYDDFQEFEAAILNIQNMLGKITNRFPFASLAFYANSLIYHHDYAVPENDAKSRKRKEELLTSYYVSDRYYVETRLPIFSSDYRIIGYHKSYDFYHSYDDSDSDNNWIDDPNDFGFNEVNSGNA